MIHKLLFAVVAFISLTVSAQSKIVKGDIKLFIVSDMGRNGYYDQKRVADIMGTVAEEIGPDAVLALGDTHHYGGVESINDPLWMTNYELIYSHPELMVNWYPICGNHEYRGNTQAVIDYSGVSRRWVMPARYYTKTFEDDGVSLKIIFLDTPPLIDKYRRKTDVYPDASEQDADAQLQWLEKTLSESTEDWIIVAGHHPIYAYTDKTESERKDMQKKVDVLLQKYRVDMYVCGHIHNFQHIRRPDSGIDYVVNTSGSLTRKPQKMDGTVFCSDSPGFSVLTADKDTLRLNMVDKDGNVIHTVVRNR